jgi:hypothetical protein
VTRSDNILPNRARKHGAPYPDLKALMIATATTPVTTTARRVSTNIRRMSRSELAIMVEQASAAGRVLGVRLPIDDDDEEPWLAMPSRRKVEQPIVGVMSRSPKT